VESNAGLTAQQIVPLSDAFVSGINTFGFSTARLLYDTETNVALSPVSIEMALAMTRTGASGETADEMKTALGLKDLSDDEIVSACRSLMWRSNTGGMEAANALWLGEKYTFQSEFLDTCTQDFMADALPLHIPGAMNDINAWASEKTHGRIDKILEQELSEDTEIVLTNALYFLGDWEMPFEANDTHDGAFSAPDGTVTVPFMFSDRQTPYYQGDGFSMISLDFQSQDGEGQYAMAFLLPEEGSSASEMLSAMTGDTFSAALDGMEAQQTWIKLPKFEYTFFAPLKETLKALGMQLCFDPDIADFGAMTEEPNQLYIDHVLHKCYIRIDELGAEAAAVTEVAAEDAAAAEDPPKFYADRPFVFAIYSHEDGAIAFLGIVNDPTKA
jgi:serpin B